MVNHLILNLKKEVLTGRNRQFKSHIDNDLNSAKVNVIDPTKDNSTPPLSIKGILDALEFLRMIITEPYQYQKMKI